MLKFFVPFLYLFTYTGAQTRVPCQMMFVSFNSKLTRSVSLVEQLTANPSRAHELTTGFQWGACSSIFSFVDHY